MQTLDDVVVHAEVVRLGFEHALAAIAPDTLKGRSKRSHAFSQNQYPVLVPTGASERLIINEKRQVDGVKAIVIADSTTGETEIWQPLRGRAPGLHRERDR